MNAQEYKERLAIEAIEAIEAFEFHKNSDSSIIHPDKYQIDGAHYASKAVQPWSAMEAWMPPEQFKGFLRGNIIKYIARAGTKKNVPAAVDYDKAMHYLAKLIDIEEKYSEQKLEQHSVSTERAQK